MIRSFKRNIRKSRKSRKSKKMRGGRRNGPSFAAKLGAFILEGLKNTPCLDGDDSHMQKEVSGAIPYLHMNIKQSDVTNKFKETEQQRISGLKSVCMKKGLEHKLKSVNFNCLNQSSNGVKSINSAIIDSINNRWGMRKNGRKHLKTIHKYMKKQVENGEIPKSSLDWAKGLN